MGTRIVDVGGVQVGGGGPLALIAGPCVIESAEATVEIARRLADICSGLDVPLIFKSSFDKANRTAIDSYRGPGIDEGLAVLAQVKDEVGVPVLSDVHEPAQADRAAAVLDILQVPAFLCRQTDLVTAAAQTGRPVNVKKGQFLAPWDMKHVVGKIESAGNEQILLTERGSAFGYNNLVADMRSLPILRAFGYPVVFDATHSVQLPGGRGGSSGGQREMVAPLARAATAAGLDALFLEVHPRPETALSDPASMLRLDDLPDLLRVVVEIHAVAQSEEAP
ncbi:MAG: 3-deoxy-8-phosphooctulonate synthase [bacterium]